MQLGHMFSERTLDFYNSKNSDTTAEYGFILMGKME